ncbi:hypothetical protein HMPREF2531_02250 [Bacteroides intestinalis]|uniref:Uncharacterized protein n=1 Tax=Bacteroides intestinalis TaxID=329854 RepID=A0A139LI06_9BACE|nr:hypothetical protein HMPREF2531_02250 [Bacteroides intestinalis]
MPFAKVLDLLLKFSFFKAPQRYYIRKAKSSIRAGFSDFSLFYFSPQSNTE